MISALDEAKSIISTCLDIPIQSIKDDSSISSHGDFDSLSFEKVILETEKRLGKKIKAVQLLKVNTVTDFAEFITACRNS